MLDHGDGSVRFAEVKISVRIFCVVAQSAVGEIDRFAKKPVAQRHARAFSEIFAGRPGDYPDEQRHSERGHGETKHALTRFDRRLVVFGAGGIGLNVIQGAQVCGAERIIAVDVVEKKLDLAKVFGATDTVNPKQGDWTDQVRSLTGGKGADFVFEVVGNPDLIQQAFAAVRRGGKLVLVGVPALGQQVTFPAMNFPLEEQGVIGSYYGSPRFRDDMPRILDLYMAKRIRLDELVSRKLKLDEINTAMSLIEQGEVARSVIVHQ